MSAYDAIDKTARAQKYDALVATADIGRANGMRVGAKILRALAKGRRTVSGAELISAATQMEDVAAKVDAKAMEAIKAFAGEKS